MRGPNGRDCARALWLLGLTPPVSAEAVAAAWRERVARAHPDRHRGTAEREQAAEVLTRALNEARDVLVRWIDEGRPWPTSRGRVVIDLDPREDGEEVVWPPQDEDEAEREPDLGPVCRQTGLRRGDRVRVWPFDGDVEVVAGVEAGDERTPTVVRLVGGERQRAQQVRLAAYSCPVCGACAGPRVEEPSLRPCPDCLVDLRRLEQDARDASRIRKAIEARSTAGLAAASTIGDRRLEDRARDRRRWARRLVTAEQDDLHAALLERFSRAFETWGATARPVG